MFFENQPKRQQARRANVVRRLEQFFLISNLRCANCGEWHGDHESFGIRDEAEWEARMTTEIRWFFSHPKKVAAALPLLEDEWPSCCESVRDILRLAA